MAKYVRSIYALIYIIIILILQTTVLRLAEIFHIIPNLLLASVICASLIYGDQRGLVFGVICGLLLDISSGRAVGINTLLCLYSSFFCIWICDRLYNNNEIIAAVFTLVITILYELLTFLVHFILWNKTGIAYALLIKILPEALYNAIAAVFLYPIIKRVIRGKRKRRKKKKEELYYR